LKSLYILHFNYLSFTSHVRRTA